MVIGICCISLLALLGTSKVACPGSSRYSDSLSSYFALQASALHPSCIASPTSTSDVSKVVAVLAAGSCKFAVRSGGHMWVPGASNIDAGVTVDLSALDSIQVGSNQTVSVGVAASWDSVFAALETHGLSVTGLTLGGGISHFGPRFGWTSSQQENRDLFRGLKGGSNNFGIVTRIDFKTFAQGPLWAATIYHPLDTIDEQMSVFADISKTENYDDLASYITGQGSQLLPSGVAQYLFATTTFQPILQMLHAAFDAWVASLDDVRAVEGVTWSLSLEPLPEGIFRRYAKGNVMGLENRRGTLIVCLLSQAWADPDDNDRMYAASKALVENLEKAARRLGAYDPFLYLNYAAPWQNPIQTYGKASQTELQKLRARVDPRRVFTKLLENARADIMRSIRT
ncbi:hypothetical protein B0I35DRAFT_495406 [Stachybotrys elegans]|uniref:FAD-binding PCMH-type domain-containing protein n=1 Tax=Stachybotrys elegans TaxID=80388 RepID=A0A8K0S9X3_9HYPO|nr:hypothetical protein B0I35DRAFT_495406 [Stachybotrys elegans]